MLEETIEELAQRYNTGNYICLYLSYQEQEDVEDWVIVNSPAFDDSAQKYRLVHKRDKEALKGWMSGEEVEILWDAGLSRECWKTMADIDNDFIVNYSERATFRATNASPEKQIEKEPYADLLQELLTKRYLAGHSETNLLSSYRFKFVEDDLSIELTYDRFDDNWHYVREPNYDPRERAVSECAWLVANGDIDYSEELNKEISAMLETL